MLYSNVGLREETTITRSVRQLEVYIEPHSLYQGYLYFGCKIILEMAVATDRSNFEGGGGVVVVRGQTSSRSNNQIILLH